jgi:hypothetical protein
MRMVNKCCCWSDRLLPQLALAGLLVIGGCKTTGTEPAVNPKTTDVPTAQDAGDEVTPLTTEEMGAREAVAASSRQLQNDRQAVQFTAWQHVRAITEMWERLPPEVFPGLSTLAAQVEALREKIEQEDSLLIGQIEPEELTTNNPAFWRAMLETNPEDPVVSLFEQMLWASRGYFDRANWLIELDRYGPALPQSVHRTVYSLADEMQRLRSREAQRKSSLLDNVTPDEVLQVISAARQFQPGHPDWLLASVVVRLQMGGVKMDQIEANPGLVNRLMETMRTDWEEVARNSPLIGARLNPEAEVRHAANALASHLQELNESRGAFGGRDLNRLSEGLAATHFYGEALMANRRAVAMRGFTIPTDLDVWWHWLPELIGAEATLTLREAMESGAVRPVSFFDPVVGPEGVSRMPLHPIMAERSLRRLQEVERRLARADISAEDAAASLMTQAETLGHLGRWDQAEEALGQVKDSLQDRTIVMRSWLALWSGRTESLDEYLGQLSEEFKLASPAVPALANAAKGRWAEGADVFVAAANVEGLNGEFSTYYMLMAAAFQRLARADDLADKLIEEATVFSEGHDWVTSLVQGMLGQSGGAPGGGKVTEITEAGRVCEQRFYRAFERGISPEKQRALLESSVATGVVDFVEYTASLLRLRELDPQRWDPAQAPEPASEDAEKETGEEDDLTRGANPQWSIPS